MDPTGAIPSLSGTDWKSIEDFTAVEDLTVQRSAEGSLLGAVTFTGHVNVCSSEFADALRELGSRLQVEEGKDQAWTSMLPAFRPEPDCCTDDVCS
jgi:hypothetical protein